MIREPRLRMVARQLSHALPVVLLTVSVLLLAQHFLEAEWNDARLTRLEQGLARQQEMTMLLQQDIATGPAEAARYGALQQGLRRLQSITEHEPEIRPYHRILTTVMALPEITVPNAPLRSELVAAGLNELGATLAREIDRQRDQTRHSHRASSLIILLTGSVGVILLLIRLRRTRQQMSALTRRAAQALARISAVYKAAPVGMALLDPDLRVVDANSILVGMAGRPIQPGVELGAAMPELAEVLVPLLRKALQHGDGVPGQELVVDSQWAGEARHYVVTAEPVTDGGQPMLSLVVVDVTDRVAAETWRGEAVAELNHRVKNALATVQALAAQTLRGSGDDPQRFAADFSARLGALSRSHELIAASGWNGTTVEQMVHAALGPWLPSGRVAVMGPAGLPLRAAQVQALVIGLAELAGNAVRHGALSAAGGRVALSWDMGADGVVRLNWQERGGPGLPAAPPRRGFGLRFLERGLPHDLGPEARSTMRFDSGGLIYEIRFPLHLNSRAELTRAAGAAA
jgi:two-component sensor histidine kinase